ncbi:MAG: hypothetical protein OEM83_09280 [Gammaproteobacteria bacterium]|nr:hypothetical protein [Gammaproteobacteria bacterium]
MNRQDAQNEMKIKTTIKVFICAVPPFPQGLNALVLAFGLDFGIGSGLI